MAKATVAASKTPTKASPIKETSAAKRSRAPSSKAPPVPPPQAAPAVTITVKDLVASLMDRHDLPKKQSSAIVEDLFTTIVEHLKAGDRVRINGLGIIEVKDRPARMGRNPATGDSIQIKASKKVTFRASKEFKDAI